MTCKVYKVNDLGELCEEQSYLRIRDFAAPAKPNIQAGYTYWYAFIGVEGTVYWHEWSDERDGWLITISSLTPKILQMRQLTGAL